MKTYLLIMTMFNPASDQWDSYLLDYNCDTSQSKHTVYLQGRKVMDSDTKLLLAAMVILSFILGLNINW